MAEIDPVILRLIVEQGQFLSDMRNTTRAVGQSFTTMEREVMSLERQMKSSLGGISTALKGLAATAGIGVSIGQVANLADTYTRYTNSLKVAGLEGENLAKTQNDLFEIAQKYGTELGSVGTLYSRLSASSKELGLSEDQLLQLVSGTSAALKVSGQSATEASGALLQLSQALGGSTIQAEEYNSLIDGARPLLQAVANGSDRFGGSVAKLTAAVKSGSVSTKEFVQAGLRGMPALLEQADKASLTLGGSLTVLTNALGKYVGEADQSLSATSKISQGITTLASNLDAVIPALATLAAFIGVQYVAAAGAAVVSSTSVAAANTRAALTAEALSGATFQANAALLGEKAAADIAAASVTRLAVAQGVAAGAGETLLAALGGPVGAAVLALGAAFAVLSAKEGAARAAAEDLSASIEAQAGKFEAVRARKAQAAAETNNLTKKERDAITATANLTGEANLLANAWARVAAEAKRAAIEQAKAAFVDAQKNRRLAQAAADSQAAANRNRPSNQSAGSPVGAIGRGVRALTNALGITDPKAAAQREQKERGQLSAAIQNEATAREEYAKVVNSSLATFRQDDSASGAVSPNAKALAKHQQILSDLEKLKAGASGKELKTINTKIAREQAIIDNLNKGVGETAAIAATTGSAASHVKKKDHSEEEMARLAVEELQARLDLTTDVQDRADLQQDILAAERKQRVAQINDRTDLSPAERAAALKTITNLYGPAAPAEGEIPVSPGLLQQRITKDKEDQIARDALDRVQANAANEQDLLHAQEALTDSRKARRDIELRLVDLSYQQEKADLDAVIASQTSTQAQKDIAQKRLDILGELKASDVAKVNRDNEGPLAAYSRSLNKNGDQLRDQAEGFVVDEAQHVQDGLVSGLQKAIGTKDPLIAGLLNILVQQVIMKPLAAALAQVSGGSGSGLAGILGSLAGAAGSLFGGGTSLSSTSIAGAGSYDFSSFSGFAGGGYTGDGGRNQPAGIVHKGEYVVPADVVKRVGVQNIAALTNARAAASMAGVTAAGASVRAGQQNVTNYYGPGAKEFWGQVDQRAAGVADPIARQHAGQAGTTAYKQSMKDAPASVRRAQRFRTT